MSCIKAKLTYLRIMCFVITLNIIRSCLTSCLVLCVGFAQLLYKVLYFSINWHRTGTRMCKIQLLSFLSTFWFYKQYVQIFARKKSQFALKLCVEHSGTYSLYLGYIVPRLCQKYTCSEWAWFYGFGYVLKSIVPLFSISTRNLHVSPYI